MTTIPLRPGLRLRSRTCTTEVIVVRPGSGTGTLECGGESMTTDDVSVSAPATAEPRALLGKRYTDGTRTLEVLVTKAGAGPLSLDGVLLAPKESTPLPASD